MKWMKEKEKKVSLMFGVVVCGRCCTYSYISKMYRLVLMILATGHCRKDQDMLSAAVLPFIATCARSTVNYFFDVYFSHRKGFALFATRSWSHQWTRETRTKAEKINKNIECNWSEYDGNLQRLCYNNDSIRATLTGNHDTLPAQGEGKRWHNRTPNAPHFNAEVLEIFP